MDQLLTHPVRLDQRLRAAQAGLAAKPRDARGRLVGRRTRRRQLRPVAAPVGRAPAVETSPAIA
jgi:hypothetical protein